MLADFSIPYSLTDKGFVFKLHNINLNPLPMDWIKKLAFSDQWPDGVTFAVDQPKSLYLLRFSDLLIVSVSLITKTIELWSEKSLDKDLLKSILIDQLVPRIFAAQGALILHAGAVVFDGKAIAFIGESGAGKSTLVASLNLQGLELLNDDAVVVTNENDQFLLGATHQRLRLLPDSLSQLYVEVPATAPVFESAFKRRVLASDGKRHNSFALPLAALFFISKEPAEQTSLRLLPPAEAVMTIIANSFALNPTDPEFATANFYRASNLAGHIPVYELAYPRAYEALPEVRQVILNKLEMLQG